MFHEFRLASCMTSFSPSSGRSLRGLYPCLNRQTYPPTQCRHSFATRCFKTIGVHLREQFIRPTSDPSVCFRPGLQSLKDGSSRVYPPSLRLQPSNLSFRRTGSSLCYGCHRCSKYSFVLAREFYGAVGLDLLSSEKITCRTILSW